MEKFSLYDIIQDRMMDRNTKEPKPSDVWWASDTLKCHRKRYWKRTGIRGKPLNVSVLRQLSLGSTVHEWAENLLKGSSNIIGVETKVAWAPGKVRGRVDLVYQYSNIGAADGEVIYGIADIKSVHPFVFKKISENRFGDPKKQFVMFDEEERLTVDIDVFDDRAKVEASQIALYKLGLDKSETFPEITFTEGRLLYVSRADLGMIEVPFQIDEYVPKVIEDYTKLNASWDSKQVPPVLDLDKKGEVSKECKYCEFLPQCKPEIKDKVIAWKTEDRIGPVRRLLA